MCETPNAKQDEVSLSYEEKLLNCSIIAKPLASKKSTSKIYKLAKKAAKKRKTHLRMGLKAVQSKIRKGERGIVIIAGDVAPVDIICHMPAVCENKNIPYIFVPSKKDLGAAVNTLGLMQIILILKDPEYDELYEKVLEIITNESLES